MRDEEDGAMGDGRQEAPDARPGGEPVPGGAETIAAAGGPEALERAFSGGDATAMAHFYRGEMNRLTTWRSRMDVTTNWAIIATIGLLSLSLKHPSADSILIFNLAALWVLLVIESRRYRFYDVWRWRVRILEAHFLAPIVAGELRSPQGPWRRDLTADLLYPTFKISMREAMGRRLLRNLIYLFALVLAVALGHIFGISPQTASWGLPSGEHLREASQRNWLFLLILAIAYVPLILLMILGWRRRKVAVELHDPMGRRPYRV
jgi:uncharacterized membrane protein